MPPTGPQPQPQQQQPQQQRWCSECDEDRGPHQPFTDRLCDICGTQLQTRAAPADPQTAAAPTTVTIPLRQLRRLRDLLLASLTGGEGELGLAGLVREGQEGREGGEDEGDDEMADLQGLLAQLGVLGGGEGGGGGVFGGEGPRKGLADEEVAALPRSTLQKTSTLLLACTLSVEGGGQAGGIPAIPGDFSPVPPGGDVGLELVAGEPLTADAPAFANAGALEERVVVVKRGKQTFGRMVLMARAAGARGVCVVNSVPLWPYLMKDTAGETNGLGREGGEGSDWFIVMVPQVDGEALLRRLEGGAVVAGSMAVTSVEKDCVICVEPFSEGEEVVRLPACSHGFHAPCVERWLRLAKTCPYCRAEVKVRRG